MRLKNKNGYVNAAFGPQTVVEIHKNTPDKRLPAGFV